MARAKGILLRYEWLELLGSLEGEDFKSVVMAIGEIGRTEKCEAQLPKTAGVVGKFVLEMAKKSFALSKNGLGGGNPHLVGGRKSRCGAKAEKGVYGEFKNVRLTDGELEKLREQYPTTYLRHIDDLSYYIESKGDKYRSHYAAILSWHRNRNHRTDNDSFSSFDTDDFFNVAVRRSQEKLHKKSIYDAFDLGTEL